MLCLENMCQNSKVEIKKFHRKFNSLHQKGLPSLQDRSGKLIPLEEYQQRLHGIVVDKTKFAKIRGVITGKASIEGLSYDLLTQHEIRYLFLVRTTFEKYTEVDESYKKLLKFSILDEKIWEKLCELIE